MASDPPRSASSAPDAAIDIRVDGRSLLSAPPGQITSVTVEDDLGLPGAFSFELVELEAREGKSTWLDDEQPFALGGRVEIQLGYSDKLATVIAGEITALEPSFDVNSAPVLTVRGYDLRHRLQRNTRTRSYQDVSDSEVVKQIGDAVGVTIDTESSSVKHEYLLQANQNDLDFVQSRADNIDYELVMVAGKLRFRPAAYDAGASATLSVGGDLQELFLSLNLATQPSNIEVRAWSVKNKAVLVGQAASGSEKSRMGGKSSAAAQAEKAFGTADGRIVATPAASQQEVDASAAARFARAGLTLISAEGRCFGRNDLHAGSVVEIAGAGKRYSGLYYLYSVRHRYDPVRGYETRFQGRRNAL